MAEAEKLMPQRVGQIVRQTLARGGIDRLRLVLGRHQARVSGSLRSGGLRSGRDGRRAAGGFRRQ